MSTETPERTNIWGPQGVNNQQLYEDCRAIAQAAGLRPLDVANRARDIAELRPDETPDLGGLYLRALAEVAAEREQPKLRTWRQADFDQLTADDPPTQVYPDTNLMCGRVRRWVWQDRSDLTTTRFWRETAERGVWVEATA